MGLIKVTNRADGTVGYTLPDANLHRNFAAGETKNIELDELRQLSYVPGGEYILKNCLIVNDTDALNALNISVEPEYFYTEEEIKKILSDITDEGLNRLEDTLNFAPQGVIDLIKKIAVETEIPDTRKRKLISEKTGFNIDTAININHILDAEDQPEEAKEEDKVRKASPITPQRKTAAPKYKVIAEEK